MVAYLLIDQWILYQTPEIKKNTTVSTDPDKRSKIQMNMYIVFPNCPCYMIDIVMKTSVNEVNKDEMIKSLHWSHDNVKTGLGEHSYNEALPFPSVNTSDPETGKKILKFL